MQQTSSGQILYSATDLVTYIGCKHASFLDYKALTEELERSEDSPLVKLLQKKGFEHEGEFLQQLKNEGLSTVEIPKGLDLESRFNSTIQALQSGADIIFQGAFFAPPWRGDADFLIKCDTPSGLGDFSYEVVDTKLARTAEPKHIMQLCVYTDLLANLQKIRPLEMHLVLGDKEKYSYKVNDYFEYYNHTKSRFEKFLRELPTESYPDPCNHCKYCQWIEKCEHQWEQDEHLSRVANIQRTQRIKLQKAGINKVSELAETLHSFHIPDLNNEVFQRLRSQAILQNYKANTGKDKFEIISFQHGKGLTRIKPKDEGDLFFDIEGDPLYPNGLEYLFGVYFQEDEDMKFQSYWAHNHAQELETFKEFMDFLSDHTNRYPKAHIFHYNHYETTALKRLACRYAVCEENLDNFLRQHKFIDLYQVVRESLRTSEPGYTLKNLERFYMDKRDDAVSTATDSIVVYNQWRESGSNEMLQEIVKYNKVDCISLFQLRNWLIDLNSQNDESSEVESETSHIEGFRYDHEIQYEHFQSRLSAMSNKYEPVKERLIHLLEFHNREAKPQWWNCFERQNKFEDELIDDPECLGGLKRISISKSSKKSKIYRYRFPPQEYKLKEGYQPVNIKPLHILGLETVGIIEEIDDNKCIIKIKRGSTKEKLPKKLSIGPPMPVSAKIIRSAIYNYAGNFLKSPNILRVTTELLARNPPRIQGKLIGEAIYTYDEVLENAIEVVSALNNSYIIIQGPPGTGKTYTSSQLIVELIKAGKKVGISSNSHKAIDNLLRRVEKTACEKGVKFSGVKKATRERPETIYCGKYISSKIKTEELLYSSNDLFAGTAWCFSHAGFRKKLDYLFIDEAGQVSIANVIAMSMAAENIILIGDQMQLGQPIQGVHPGEAGLSVLDFLLGDQSTIGSDRGIFLGQSYRMRPSVCKFVSDAFYDGRLKSHESTLKRKLNLQDVDLPNEGIVMIPAIHSGCSQKSVEEGEIVKAKYESLIDQSFTDSNGNTRPISENDILVVSPFNVQVNHLSSILPNFARVGTVDKFQGQEAPIVMISMVTSSAEDLPGRVNFLLSRNRLNVAISRAQCLTIVIANPQLLETPCRTVEQMKLVNTFCWIKRYAQIII